MQKNITEKELKFIFDKVSKTHGMGASGADLFIKGLEDFKKSFNSIKEHVTFAKPPKLKSKKLEGKTFMFTGFRDKDVEQYIIENGGKIGSSVNKNTTVLFAKETGTLKTKAAEKLGVKIVSASKCKSYFKL